MGQYFIVVNLDDKTWVDPHNMNDLAKAVELGSNPCGLMTGIAALLGNGDWKSKHIALLGDYTEPTDKAGSTGLNWNETVGVNSDLDGQSSLHTVISKSSSWNEISKHARHLSYKTGNVSSGFSAVNTKKLGHRATNSVIFNEDKREFLDPKNLGDFLFWEDFAVSPTGGILSAFAGLLLTSNGQGGGDYPEHPLIGSWAGDKISVGNASSASGKDISIPVQSFLKRTFGVKFKELDNGEWARYTYSPTAKKETWVSSDGDMKEGN